MKRAMCLRLSKTNLVWLVPLIVITLMFCSSQQLQAQTATEEQTVKQLRRALEQRDALVQNLLQRVEQLEQRVGVSADRAQAAAPTPPARSARAEPSRPSQQAQAEPAEAKPAGPGAFEVDEKAAERALERTLTAAGDLLLPAGGVELQTSFSYTRDVQDFARLISANIGDDQVVLAGRNAEARQNQYNLSLGMRAGLPFDSQFELRVPYRIVDQDVLVPQGLEGFDKNSDTDSAIGDISVGFAKTLLRERGWWPDLIGRVTWDTDSGERNDGDLMLGGNGFNELRLSLTTLKRQDPLAFVAGLSYEKTFEKNNIEPGDQYGLNLGVTLAASPETALRASLQQVFSREDKIDGRTIEGSDGVSSSMVFGASTIVGRGMLLSLTPSIGLTDDAPDYSVNLFATYRLR